jgi:hypothetical protein
MAITQRRVTLEEFLTWPEEEPSLEYVDGVVSQSYATSIRPSADLIAWHKLP